jgi:hypothetical protein
MSSVQKPALERAPAAVRPELVLARRRRPSGDVVAPVLGAGAVGLCIAALVVARRADVGRMGDFGLVSVLPPVFFVALAALSVTFSLNLRRRDLRAVSLIVHIAALVFMLYGVAPFMEGIPRTQSTWKLAGVAEYVMSHGAIDPDIDAFFNWPGFFILTALFTRLAGLSNPITYAAWAPVFFNTLFVVPVFVIIRTATADPRRPWLGVWLFCLANWIGQDYLAPQALNYVLFLVILIILLKWFPTESRGRAHAAARGWVSRMKHHTRPGEVPPARSTAWQRVALMAIVVLLYSATVPSHQLTPWVSLIVIGVLVAARRLTARRLPVLMLLLATAWLSYMAVRFLNGHFAHVIAPVGSVNENVNANLTDRFAGSSAHLTVAYVRAGMSALVLALAGVGAVRRFRAGRADFTFVLLAAVPFLLLPLQTYGGELLMRAYLFALPAVVFFAAAAFLGPVGRRLSWTGTVGIAVVSVILSAAWLVSRYGDERMHYFTPAERTAVSRLYDMAPPGAQLVSLNVSLPWRHRLYDAYKYVSVEQKLGGLREPDLIHYLNGAAGTPSYLIVTRAQLAAGTIENGWSPGTWDRLRAGLERSGVIKLVYANRDAQIFTMRRAESERDDRVVG